MPQDSAASFCEAITKVRMQHVVFKLVLCAAKAFAGCSLKCHCNSDLPHSVIYDNYRFSSFLIQGTRAEDNPTHLEPADPILNLENFGIDRSLLSILFE